jgi:hypothetical protein
LDVAGAHFEHRASQVIVVRIEVEREAVGVGGLVAARQAALDLRRVAIEQFDPHVQSVVVVKHTQVRVFGRWFPLVGIPLHERVGRRRDRPRRFLELAVDHDGATRTNGGKRAHLVVVGRLGQRWRGHRAQGDENRRKGRYAPAGHDCRHAKSDRLRCPHPVVTPSRRTGMSPGIVATLSDCNRARGCDP